MDPRLISNTKSLLEDKSRRIVIVTHTNPDGDAVGSSLGMYICLRNAGCMDVEVVVPNAYPGFLKWLPFNEKVIVASDRPQKARELIMGADLVFCLDFNGFSRIDALQDVLVSANGVKVLIDHHPEPEPGFDLVFSYPGSSSTAELVYEFFEALGWSSCVDQEAAECLYAGIVTDTGSFSYSCNNPGTYLITAKLIRTGVDGERIHRLIYNTYSSDRMRLLGYCLSERLVVMPEQQTAYISLGKNDLDRFHYQEGDTEGVVNYALSIENISLAALFTEHEDHIKVSFRSAGDVDVNRFARDHFNGGGHVNAAGGKSFDPMESTLLRFEELVKALTSG